MIPAGKFAARGRLPPCLNRPGRSSKLLREPAALLREYIARQPGWELAGIFADEGLSGTSTKKRLAFQRMIACARARMLDLIVTKEISRFARNTLDSIYYTRELKRLGIGVLFLSDNLYTLDGDAELRLTILASIAQEESRRTSERVKWGQKRRMEQGVVFGRDLLGYDVRGGVLIVNEPGAQIVRDIFRKFVNDGKGAHTIARELNEAGVPAARGGPWRSSVILRILRNEKYCGDLVQKKTYTPDYLTHEKKYNRGQEAYVVLRDHHAPIIPRATFEAAGRILTARAQSQDGQPKHSRRYPLSGKLRCGVCGANCAARCKARRDGSAALSWRCYAATKYGRPHTDAAGHTRGCTGESLRDEDAVQILTQVWALLPINRTGIAADVTAALNAAISPERIRPLQAEVTALLDGTAQDAVFYAQLLDRMVIHDRAHIEVRLRDFPGTWRFMRAETAAPPEMTEAPLLDSDIGIQRARKRDRNSRVLGFLRVFKEFMRLALLADDAVGHIHDVAGDIAREGHFMRDDDHRQALFGQAAHDIEHLADHLRIERARRLIKQQHFRLHSQRTGDGHTLLLTAGELRRPGVDIRRHADLRQVLHGVSSASLRLRLSAETCPAMQLLSADMLLNRLKLWNTMPTFVRYWMRLKSLAVMSCP